MYGREKSAVVSPMKAVSAIRNALNGSMKNCSRPRSRLPSAITRAVSAPAATNVPALSTTLSSGAQRRPPTTASSNAPVSGVASSSTSSISPFPQRLEVVQIQAVELLADLEEEHTQHQHRDQDVERHAKLDDHRHSVGGAHRAEEQPVLHRQETDYLRQRLAACDHHQERQQDHADGNAERAARRRARELGDRLRETERENHDQQPDHHGPGGIDQRLGLPVDLEPANQPVQQPRKADDLETEC